MRNGWCRQGKQEDRRRHEKTQHRSYMHVVCTGGGGRQWETWHDGEIESEEERGRNQSMATHSAVVVLLLYSIMSSSGCRYQGWVRPALS